MKAVRDKEQKLKTLTEKTMKQTCSNIVKTTIKQTTPPPRLTINLTEKTHLKTVALVIEAHVTAFKDNRT